MKNNIDDAIEKSGVNKDKISGSDKQGDRNVEIIEWRVKPRPIRLHINKTYAVCCPSDVSAGLIFSSYTCQSSRTYVYDILCAEIPHIL